MIKMKKRKDPPPNELSKWVPMFLSLMLIILAFFIVLTAYSTPDDRKIREALHSIQGLYGFFPKGGGRHDTIEGHLYGEIGDSPVDQDKLGSVLVNIFDNLDLLVRSIEDETQDHLKIEETDEDITVIVNNSVFFTSGSSQLRDESIIFLDEIAKLIKVLNLPLTVEGHTDDLPLLSRARYRDNWELSTIRAVNVIRYLIEDAGILPHKLRAKGYAHYSPIASNETAEGRSKNRRVSFVFKKINNENQRRGM